MKSYEKLGLFYLGKVVDPRSGGLTDQHLLYDSRDLLTHAVCVGMTGSGKTGLCLTLLEEAAIDGIPVIAIDPKGDLGNLLLTFPGLTPQEFRPWINEDEALRKGLSPDDYARSEADRWRVGLSEWDQDADRIRLLQSSADTALYTPGSTAGLPVSIVHSFAAPGQLQGVDLEPLRERASTTTSGLLGLLGIAADPLRSREHILISTILEQAWLAGKDMDLATLIQAIQSPGMARVGVFDLESFYPAADRLQLAMLLNNLLAAPGFGSWLEGEPLDMARLLHTPQGKPRACVFSIAHLADNERMFFVTLLLNQVLAWARSQPGTTSLRALLYMDEIFGFLPPLGDPPSKRPFLTLLKQARAFGVGIMLATQNPVDLDYKALSNAGTWFIGRLQTERDRDRLLDGLSGLSRSGSAELDGREPAQLIASLRNRVFFMHNVHDEQPVLFNTRWALSYLAGPLTRAQIRRLTASREPVTTPAQPQAALEPPVTTVAASEASTSRPALPPGLKELFAAASRPVAAQGKVFMHPWLYASAMIQIVNNKHGITASEVTRHILALEPNMIHAPWDRAASLAAESKEPTLQPPEEARYLPLPTRLLQSKPLDNAMKGYVDFLQRQWQLRLWRSTIFKLTSMPGETERDFRIRLQQLAREKRDFGLERLRQRYAAKLGSLQRQLMRAQDRVERESEQYGQQKASTAISLGSTLLGALIGRKAFSAGTLGRATTAARQASRMAREKEDIERAGDHLRAIEQQVRDLEEQMQNESDQIARAYDPQTELLQEIVIRPAKSDLLLQSFAIVWIPFVHPPAGGAEPLYP